ncbi:MAG: hypothetical protein JW798_18890 [Prolixibacteraceae bacterium]|nr:hypothetical protein [Prolixibacteraceae bacterium]
MTIKTFWTLFFKILGIWLILSGLAVTPQFVSSVAFFGDNHQENLWAVIYIIALLLLTVGLYLVVMKLLVFNPTWLIDKLKLDKGIEEETLGLNLKLTTVLTIATIVIGGLIFVDALPMLCQQIFTFIQQKSVFREDPQFAWVIFYSVKALIGYLLMTNSRLVINFINKKTENTDN